MKRPWLWLVAASLATGCQNSPPTTNPFLRTTVDPPPTGAGVPPAGAAPYNAPNSATPPATGAPSGTGKPAAGPYSPPGGSFGYPQSSNSPDDSLDVSERAARTSLTRKETKSDNLSGDLAPDGLAAADDGLPTLGRPDDGAIQMQAARRQRSPTDDAALAASTPASGGHARKASGVRRDAPAATTPTGHRTRGSLSDILASAAGDAATDESRETKVDRSQSPPADRLAVADADALAGERAGTPEPPASTAGGRSSIRIVGSETTDDSRPAESGGDRPSALVATRIGVVADDSTVTTAAARTASPSAHSAVPGFTSKAPAVPSAAAASAPAARAAAGDGGRVYDRDPDYRWLRGKLEYSRTARQWKLRYIPIDGQTDRFGGSVVLPEGAVSGTFSPGDLVVARGSVEGQATGRNFSPRFAVEQIDHQNR